ncbi:MAG TPA: heme NO-binding domain-containing protein [Nannocystis sp.]
MKGVVFTEFLELVETAFSPEVADAIIARADLPSGGAYTAIGTYDHAEILALVAELSKETGAPIPTLVHTFGRHLFGRFLLHYPQFFAVPTAFEFLERVHGYIHVEVRKLYPDAELPSFEYARPDPDTLVMIYRSHRPFADLAAGLIDAAIEHWGGGITVAREPLDEPGRTAVRFTLTRQSRALAS